MPKLQKLGRNCEKRLANMDQQSKICSTVHEKLFSKLEHIKNIAKQKKAIMTRESKKRGERTNKKV
ncbi:unnamed protein product [Acanthoscelides obtectus]|uniref:Uncharacterized protein n=1 Tax=Acanthoscelides obtectus TaxID=200917 RepID=A0A9P0KQL6_ACAOB|nr:unnamed protein product [Acanthoscelides obtectus]CAK1667617.1 hypothetical protein AOBTE_LOCUS25950 [Acanthoscelides obtectus]